MNAWGGESDAAWAEDERDARIAELEEENERLKTIMGICSGPCHGSVGEEYIVKVHKAVAELAALKGLIEMLERGGVRIVSAGGSYTLAEFRSGITELSTPEEKHD